jgi:branched-chain amino acid transport system permease protein
MCVHVMASALYLVHENGFDLFGHTAYVYSLVALFVLFLLARRIVNSPFGLSLLAVKGNALRASVIGIAINWRLVAIYTIAAGYAGIAGALLTQTMAFALPEAFFSTVQQACL